MKIKLNTLNDAGEFSKICEKFEEDIDLIVGRYIIDAKSYLGILSIGLAKDVCVEFHGCLNKQNKFYKLIDQWIVKEDNK